MGQLEKTSSHDSRLDGFAICQHEFHVRFVRFIFVFGALLHLGGGHWGVLQGIAWAKMLVEYSQADGLRDGIVKTFDGEHPCEMCKSISKGRESEKRGPLAPVRADGLALKDLLPMSEIRIQRRDLPLPSQPVVWPESGIIAQWSGSPDEPPPRAAIS
jgi:hypothetical protein